MVQYSLRGILSAAKGLKEEKVVTKVYAHDHNSLISIKIEEYQQIKKIEETKTTNHFSTN